MAVDADRAAARGAGEPGKSHWDCVVLRSWAGGRSEQEIGSGGFSRLNRWINSPAEGVPNRLKTGAVSKNGNPEAPVLDRQIAVEAPVPALRARIGCKN